MQNINITIEGLSPLLMHNPASMLDPQPATKKIPKPEDEAAKSAYWTKDRSSLMFPASSLHAALIRASGAYRINRKSVKSFIAGSIALSPEEVPLGTSEYEIDLRTVVVQRARIVRARAKIPTPWTASFIMTFDEQWLPEEFMEATMPEILNRAGSAFGLLDFRPQCGGPFGRFHVAEFRLA